MRAGGTDAELFGGGLSLEDYAGLRWSKNGHFFTDKSQKKDLPEFLLTKSQLSSIVDDYYNDSRFLQNHDGRVNLWNLYNYFSEATKSSSIDSFLERTDNALEIANHLKEPLKALPMVLWESANVDKDLLFQKTEIEKLDKTCKLIYAGDFNISFSGLPYPSKKVVLEMTDFFNLNSLAITTSENKDSAIHIVVSNEILDGRVAENEMISIERKISDHHLVLLDVR